MDAASVHIAQFFTCGRRSAGLLATLVVVVWGGGLLYMGTGRAGAWFLKISKARSHISSSFLFQKPTNSLDAHA